MIEETAAFLLTPHEVSLRSATHQHRALLSLERTDPGAPLSSDLVVELDGGRGRLRFQLLKEHRSTSIELLHCLACPAEQEAESHHLPVDFLTQRVVMGETAGIGESLLVGATGLGRIDQPAESDDIALPVMILIDNYPVVVETGHEVTAIEPSTGSESGHIESGPRSPLGLVEL